MATYYVATNGSNSNTGLGSSAGLAWLTIGKAAATMVAGDTTIVRDGTYVEGTIDFLASGTAGNPITLIAENQWLAILSSTSNTTTTSYPAISLYGSYITIENMRIQDNAALVVPSSNNSANSYIQAWDLTSPNVSGTPATTGYTNTIVRGVKMDTSTKRYCAYKSTQDASILENSDVGSSIEIMRGRDAIVRNNIVRGTTEFNVYYINAKGGSRDCQIYNNTIYQNDPTGPGICLGGLSGTAFFYDPSAAIECYNGVAYNNIIINQSTDQYITGLAYRGSKDCAFVNNIAYGGTGMAARVGGVNNSGVAFKASGCKTYNNIFFRNGNGDFCPGRDGDINSTSDFDVATHTFNNNCAYNWSSDVPTGTSNITTNPLFVDFAGGNYRLQAGSPCLNTGATVTIPKYHGGNHSIALDVAGVSRPQGAAWDMGIYETVESSGPRFLPFRWA